MKWMVASDIHGSSYYCRLLVERFAEEKAERLVLLGDLLYHGPRNDLPRDYDTKATAALLNTVKDSLICVRGNCDAEIDQMLLSFPMLAEYAVFPVNGHLFYATHGHHACEEEPLPHSKGDYMLCGHTHVPGVYPHEDFTYLNPGSVSIPKENSCHSYMMIEDGLLSWKNLETGETFLSHQV